jgi:hypothetical protein
MGTTAAQVEPVKFSLQWLLSQTFVALQYMKTMGVRITVGHISDSSKDISDCHLPKDIPTLTMVKTGRGGRKSRTEKLQDLYDNP